ncbi:MAG: Minf_1886 family protein [Candidatus Omnitrophota bacterium]
MKKQLDVIDILESVTDKDPRYKVDAYLFVLNGLNHTVSRLEKPRHVNGQELSEGLRIYAIDQYGPPALTVLESWGLEKTSDFGNIVFNLIGVKLLSKTDNDSIDDFSDVFDFKKALARTVDYKLE